MDGNPAPDAPCYILIPTGMNVDCVHMQHLLLQVWPSTWSSFWSLPQLGPVSGLQARVER
jgi:hypothetical protein